MSDTEDEQLKNEEDPINRIRRKFVSGERQIVHAVIEAAFELHSKVSERLEEIADKFYSYVDRITIHTEKTTGLKELVLYKGQFQAYISATSYRLVLGLGEQEVDIEAMAEFLELLSSRIDPILKPKKFERAGTRIVYFFNPAIQPHRDFDRAQLLNMDLLDVMDSGGTRVGSFETKFYDDKDRISSEISLSLSEVKVLIHHAQPVKHSESISFPVAATMEVMRQSYEPEKVTLARLRETAQRAEDTYRYIFRPEQANG